MTAEDTRYFTLRRLHSLAGVLPLGVFLLEHFYVNSAILAGAEVYNAEVDAMWGLFRSKNALLAVEILFIWIPLAFHLTVGLAIWRSSKSNAMQYGTFRNWMYTLQRGSGVFLVVFIVYHMWFTWRVVHVAWDGTTMGANPFDPTQTVTLAVYMAQYLTQSYFQMAFYVAGIFAASLHFSNGLWNAAITWGVTVGERSMRASTVVCACLFAALFTTGMSTLAAFVRLASGA